MRQPTQDEVNEWIELARKHGHLQEDESFALGRWIIEGTEEGHLVILFVTPVPAGLTTEDLGTKTPPILFDRTPTGEIILPGRWWQNAFERLSEHEGTQADVRQTAKLAARHVLIGDAYLPADTDTVQMLVPDDQGNMVPTEALKPGTRALLRLIPRGA